ncbi:hypothetical protein [Wenjunlia tyrosinilytica]|uniref:Uncharacterized protein n=1 Tax=Wenjunlia tyrosinilytica TaxID=1544741 RepID=A0A917ZJJ7_9ACTN|nr:hypothetical protein [Wenjunlia tyrosinilytica]GGO83169.1 hypothetical protein GCM10012280_11500 [Wenjunlia tyrosinilytica]
MLTTTTRVGTAAAATAVLVGAFVLSSRTENLGQSVRPGIVTATYKCADQVGDVKLSAAKKGSDATVEVRLPDFKSPVPLFSGVLRTRLTLARTDGGTVTFEGADNPTIARGEPVRSGPLKGTIKAGDLLDSRVGRQSLSANVLGYKIKCVAKSKLAPGPLAF